MAEQEQFLIAISTLPHIQFERRSAIHAGFIFRSLAAKGSRIAHADAQIAGSYLAYGVTAIVTRNVKQFSRIADLQVLEY